MIFKAITDESTGAIKSVGLFGKPIDELKKSLSAIKADGLFNSIFNTSTIDETAIRKYNAEIEKAIINGATMAEKQQIMKTAMEGTNKDTAQLIGSTKGAIVEIEALATAQQASTIKAKAYSAALKAASIAGNMVLFAFIGKGLEFFDSWIHRAEKANEAMNNAVSEYDSAKSKLEGINTELVEQNKQLDKLLAKDKLTYAEQGQLEELQAITKELLLQQDIEERRADIASKEAAEKAVDAYQKQYGKYDKTEDYLKLKMSYDIDFITSEDENDILGNVAAYIRVKKLIEKKQADFDKQLADGEDFNHLSANLQSCIDLADNYSKSIDKSIFDLQEKRLALEDEYQKAIANRESGLEPLTTSDQEIIDSYESIYSLMKLVYKYTDQNAWSSMEIENIFNTKGIEKTKAELIEMAKAGRLTPEVLEQYPNLNTAIKISEIFLQDGQTAAEAFCHEIIACANESNRLTNSFGPENPLSFSQAASSLDTFQSSVKSAYDAYAALLSGSYTASELLDSIQAITKAAADMGETINWEALSGQEHSLQALQEEIDRISQSYAESVLNDMGLKPDSDLGKLLTDIIQEAHAAEMAFTGMNTQLDRLQSSYQTLTDFLAAYHETGTVSLEQLQSLLTADENLIAMLEVENGQLLLCHYPASR